VSGNAPAVDAATVADLRLLAAAALARIAPVLRRRRDAGRVREGHGDLRADHICCTDALPIIDCVEFSARLRTCDVASEVAFLASELDFLDAPALADALVAAYVRASATPSYRSCCRSFALIAPRYARSWRRSRLPRRRSRRASAHSSAPTHAATWRSRRVARGRRRARCSSSSWD